MHSTSRDASTAHDASVHIMKLRIEMVPGLRQRHRRPRRSNRRYQPGVHIVDLLPERRHIHDQILDHRQVAERRHHDVPVSLKFFAKGGSAGQFFATIDRHGAGSADGGPAGIAERQTPVALLLDPYKRIEDGHPAPDVEPDLFRMGYGIDFWIESLNREGQAHRLVLSHEC